jgi:hypothetical protein
MRAQPPCWTRILLHANSGTVKEGDATTSQTLAQRALALAAIRSHRHADRHFWHAHRCPRVSHGRCGKVCLPQRHQRRSRDESVRRAAACSGRKAPSLASAAKVQMLGGACMTVSAMFPHDPLLYITGLSLGLFCLSMQIPLMTQIYRINYPASNVASSSPSPASRVPPPPCVSGLSAASFSAGIFTITPGCSGPLPPALHLRLLDLWPARSRLGRHRRIPAPIFGVPCAG